MPNETTPDYRSGFRDALLVVEATLQMQKQHGHSDEKSGLETAMDLIAKISAPIRIR